MISISRVTSPQLLQVVESTSLRVEEVEEVTNADDRSTCGKVFYMLMKVRVKIVLRNIIKDAFSISFIFTYVLPLS